MLKWRLEMRSRGVAGENLLEQVECRRNKSSVGRGAKRVDDAAFDLGRGAKRVVGELSSLSWTRKVRC